VVVLALLASTIVIGAGRADAAPSISVSPNTNLTDGQLVTVTASGLSTTTHELAECSGPTEGTCEFLWHQPGSGDLTAISTTIRARTTVMHFDGTVADCRTTACTLAVLNTNDSSIDLEASTPLSFDPSSSLQPIPSLTVNPNTNVTFQMPLHVTAPAYLNPDDSVLVFVCIAARSFPPNELLCSVVSETHTTGPDGALDITYPYAPNQDATRVPHAVSGTCMYEDGCAYVAVLGGSFHRMLLGEVRIPGAVVPTSTTTTTASPASSTTSTSGSGARAVVATPRFTG